MDIGLNQIEREYHDASFNELEELRRNSLVRLSRSDIIQAKSKFVALDKAKEFLHQLTKLIPLDLDTESWGYHNRNITFANKYNVFEKQGQVNHHLQYEDSEEHIITKVNVTKAK